MHRYTHNIIVCSKIGLFEKRFHDLGVTLKAYQDLNIKIQQDSKDLEEFRTELDKERDAFEKEREKWKRDLEQAKTDISEQNDRLTFLSQQLTGHKVSYMTYIITLTFKYILA